MKNPKLDKHKEKHGQEGPQFIDPNLDLIHWIKEFGPHIWDGNIQNLPEGRIQSTVSDSANLDTIAASTMTGAIPASLSRVACNVLRTKHATRRFIHQVKAAETDAACEIWEARKQLLKTKEKHKKANQHIDSKIRDLYTKQLGGTIPKNGFLPKAQSGVLTLDEFISLNKRTKIRRYNNIMSKITPQTAEKQLERTQLLSKGDIYRHYHVTQKETTVTTKSSSLGVFFICDAFFRDAGQFSMVQILARSPKPIC